MAVTHAQIVLSPAPFISLASSGLVVVVMPVLADELARLQAHRWQISDLSFSPDGTRLASAGWDKEVNIWELSNLERVLNLSDVHRVPVTSVSWLRPNGLLICTGSADRTAALWNAETGAHVASLTDHAGWVLDTDFSATGAFLATACWDHTVRIWDPGSEKVVNSLTGHGGGVWSVEFHPNSSQLCTASEDKSARIWDTRMNRPAGSLYGQHTDAVYCAAWSPDGSVIATGSADNKVRQRERGWGSKVSLFLYTHRFASGSRANRQSSTQSTPTKTRSRAWPSTHTLTTSQSLYWHQQVVTSSVSLTIVPLTGQTF